MMATANSISDITPPPAPTGAELLVQLAAMPPDQLETLLSRLSETFAADRLLIAVPDASVAEFHSTLRTITIPATKTAWTLTAADFLNSAELARKHQARAILILGPESASLTSTSLHDLASAVLTANTTTDLAVPFYQLPPHAGLVNSAILYPLTRALFAQRVRFPLAIDLGLSIRMADRLAAVGQRFSGANQGEAIVWPVNEAAVAGYAIHEVEVGTRALPQPIEFDLNAILAIVAGSLFADVDSKAAFWQRARALPPPRTPVPQPPFTEAAADIAPMLDSFRLAYTNLREIWSLVLPPNSLLGLKRLSITDAATFRMPDNLWARIVYDFLLAYRLRTINRGHLLGALTPLYLAWVASHINITASGTNSERHIEAVAAAFEADKPYLVSRWRWPDRFNP
jgi:hypothetical protein